MNHAKSRRSSRFIGPDSSSLSKTLDIAHRIVD
jgi:hypothetical protein